MDGEGPAVGTKRKADDTSLPSNSLKRIKALDQDVINKIAAGEIIVAPAHALKELIENAVDAGASSLEIVSKEGGMKLLQITDNGHGINKDDLSILCERFTTSKLKDFEDLMSMSTYGFRGEALASISHIAHLTVTTKVKESSCAWKAHYSAGKLMPAKPGQSSDPKPTAGRQGTQITVEDLFYNTPQRRKAFSSASDEYSKILDMVNKYAVHCVGVGFTCKKHGESSMGVLIQREASVVDRIRSTHGSAIANELIHIDASDDHWGFKADAYVTNGNYNGKKFRLLLFINHRAVESDAVKKAIESTYSTYLPKGGHPFAYLSLEIDPQRVDVNVHPTKRQVNFLNEDEIIECVCEALRNKLGGIDATRTFKTQSLLPGVTIPTISSDSVNTLIRPSRAIQMEDQAFAPSTPVRPPSFQPPTKVTTTKKPYENNLVRTDSREQKITSFLHNAMSTTKNQRSPPRDDSVVRQDSIRPDQATEENEDVFTDKKYGPCRLASVKSLRLAVRSSIHNGLTEIFSGHTYIGLVDHTRRIAAIQSGVKLFMVDYGLVCAEFFYQLGLTDFGNFGQFRFREALQLREIMRIAVTDEQAGMTPQMRMKIDWDGVVSNSAQVLIDRRAMLSEYFMLDITSDGLIHGVPMLLKDYMPSIGKLPRFLLRLGPKVDWSDERNCFRTFLRELASWYVPDAVPNAPSALVPIRIPDDNMEAEMTQEDGDPGPPEQEAIVIRREEITRAMENVLFPAFKARLIATQGMLDGVHEVADLKGLYKVFERC